MVPAKSDLRAARAARLPLVGRLLDPRGLIIALLGSLLIFANLGDHLLWQDEAETAVLSESILANGRPLAFDGRNLVFQTPDSFDDDYVWTFHPWGQFYVTALSFALFGASTLSARLPFALAGLLVLLFSLSFYRRRLGFSPNAAFLTALILTLSVPFLLHVRQCRYYALATLFTLLLVDAFVGLLEKDPGRSAERRRLLLLYALAGICLFYTNFGTFIPCLLALGLYALLRGRNLLRSRDFIATNVLMAVPVVFGFLYFDAIRRAASQEHSSDVSSVENLALFLKFLDEFCLPIPLLLSLLAVACWGSVRRSDATAGCRASLREVYAGLPYGGLFLTLIAVNVLFFSATADSGYVRYLVHLLPFLVALVTPPVLWLAKVSGRMAAAAGLVLYLLLVNLNLPVVSLALGLLPLQTEQGSTSPGGGMLGALAGARDAVNSDHYAPRLRGLALAGYLYEITHGYRGYLGPVLDLLRSRARPGDTVLIGYEDIPVIFYTDLTVRGGLQKIGMRAALRKSPTYGLEMEEPPDFIVWTGFTELETLLIQRLVYGMGAEYETRMIDVPRLLWENRPDPWYHKYRSPPADRRIAVWCLEKGGGSSRAHPPRAGSPRGS